MSLTCSECGAEHETIDDFETDSVREFEVEEDGSFSLYENNDLFLCKDCRKPMGVGRSR
ncbi:hypothetical protein ACFQH2_16420 [Natronoarchaeum sp. GCM10025703]|uniref:hypothetical protein n=1 Tax=unclassified Natronoarchaeum TaxID=2620183 RepID=UPI003610AD61